MTLGAFLEVRLIPVLMWSYTAVTLGAALAGLEGAASVAKLAVAIIVGALLQGLVAHAVNEVADWRSGTDAHPAPRVISGGSKVIVAGILREREVIVIGAVAAVAATAIGLVVAVVWTPVVLVLGLVGLVGAVLYTLPPVRAAYRPLAGEIVAIACVWSCVTGSYALQTGTISAASALVGVAYALACASMLQVHHLLDREPDLAARPPKRTTAAVLGGGARLYGVALGAGATLAATAAAITVAPGLAVLAAGTACAVVAQLLMDPDDPGGVTRAELAVIVLVGGSGLVAATLLWAPAAAALALAAGLVPLELAVAGRALADRPRTAPPPARDASSVRIS